MNNTDLSNLKNKIKRLIIKDVSFDVASDQTDFRIVLTDYDYRVLKKEAEKVKLSKYELDKVIDELKGDIKFEPSVSEKIKMIPTDFKLGQHIRLITRDETGEAIEELIYTGEFNFVLTKHERGSLQLLDELKSETSPWNVGGYIDFRIFRNGKRVIKEDNLSIYRTKKIFNIQLLTPQFDFERFYEDKFLSEPKKDDTEN